MKRFSTPFFIILFGLLFLPICNSHLSAQSETTLTTQQTQKLGVELGRQLLSALQKNAPSEEFNRLFLLNNQDLTFVSNQYKSANSELSDNQLERSRLELKKQSEQAMNTLKTYQGKVTNVELLNTGATTQLNLNWVGIAYQLTIQGSKETLKMSTVLINGQLKILAVVKG